MTSMLELYKNPWRLDFERLLQSVTTDLLIVAPFIKYAEARWVCQVLSGLRSSHSVRLLILTSLRSESILSGMLDLTALIAFYDAIPNSKVVNLPRLHAKVYVADDNVAIVTSANLTGAGLDSNYEYGVGIKEPHTVKKIRSHLEAYAHLGNVLTYDVLTKLSSVAEKLSSEYQELQRSTQKDAHKRFNQELRQANDEFVKAQVGTRSANSLYSDAIVYVLREHGPLSTEELHPRIQRLLPDLCDDSIELVINDQHFGKRWKHAVRNAQQYLKKNGVIVFDGKKWTLL